ncbi:hypothetical protein D9M69_524620 [compost metagenome]
MLKCLAHQPQVLGIELHGFEGREGLVVQDVQIALDAPGLGIAPAAHEAEPARQAQEGQRPRHGFVRRLLRAGRRGQVGTQLIVGGKRRHAIGVEHEPDDLPGIALQRGQPRVEKQRPGHAFMAIAAVEESIAGGRVLPVGRQVPQGVVEQR